MVKKEFLKELDIRLSVLDYEVKKDILYDYEEHFRIALYEGKTEEEVCATLGNPHEIAETYLIENYHVTPKEIKEADRLQPIGYQSKTEYSNKIVDRFSSDKILGVSVKNIEFERLVVQETDKDSVYVQFSQDSSNLFFFEQKGDILHVRKNRGSETGIINIYVPKHNGLSSLYILDCIGDIRVKNTKINRCKISLEDSDTIFEKTNINDLNITSSDGSIKILDSDFNSLKFDSSDGDFEMKSSKTNSLLLDTSDGNVTISNSKINNIGIDTSDGDVFLSKINVWDVKIDSSDGNISLSDITGNNIKIDTSDGDIHASNCMFDKCKMDTSGGSIYAASSNFNELTVDVCDGDVNLNIGEINTLKCENSDGNIKINIMNYYNSVEIENSDGDIELNIPWEISFSGHIENEDGRFNSNLPVIYNNGDIKYSAQQRKESRIIINNSDGNIFIGYSNKGNGKESRYEFSEIDEIKKSIEEAVNQIDRDVEEAVNQIDRDVEEVTKQIDNINFESLLSNNDINNLVNTFSTFGKNFIIPPIPPIPPTPPIPNFNSNKNNHITLNYVVNEWIKSTEISDNAAVVTKVTSPKGVGIQNAYRLGDDKHNLAEIIYETKELEKNKHYALAFWIKDDMSKTQSSNSILQAEIIMDCDYENRDIFELSLITPVNTMNNWKLYELPFEISEQSSVLFKIAVQGCVVFFTN